MAFVKRILFLTLVVSFLCVDSVLGVTRNGGKDEVIHKDIGGVLLGVGEISDERERRHATRFQNECLECDDSPEDWAIKKQLHIRLKRGTESKIRKKKKKRLKKIATPSSSSHSSSFSNYFSHFWKEKAVKSSQSSDETTENYSEKTGSSKPKEKLMKGDLKPKDGSLVNYFSSYWKDEEGAAKSSQSVSKTSKTISKKKTNRRKGNGKSANEKLSKKEKVGDIKESTEKKEKVNSNSLLNHFSSFWKSGESESLDNDNIEKVASKINKNKKSRKKSKNKKTFIKEQESKTKGISSSNNENVRKVKGEKGKDKEWSDNKKDNKQSGYILKKDDNINHLSEASHHQSTIGTSESKNLRTKVNSLNIKHAVDGIKVNNLIKVRKDREKQRKAKRIKAIKRNKKLKKEKKDKKGNLKRIIKTKDEIDGNQDNDSRQNKLWDEKRGTMKHLKSDAVHRQDENGDLNSSSDINDSDKNLDKDIRTSSNMSGAKSVPTAPIENISKLKSGEAIKLLKGKKRNKSKLRKKIRLKKIKPEFKDDTNKTKPVDPRKLNKQIEIYNKPEKPERINETPVVDFQGLKSGLNSKPKSNPPTDKNEASENRAKSNGDVSKLNFSNRAEVNNENVISNIDNGASDINSANVNQPAKKLTNKKLPKKKFKNNSKKESYYDTLLRAERAFKKKDEKRIRKLAALNRKTEKRFKKFQNLNENQFNEILPKAAFNFTHPKQQSEISKVSIADLKKIIITLNNYSLQQYNDGMFESDNVRKQSPVPTKDMHERPQGDDPNQYLNSLIGLHMKNQAYTPLNPKERYEIPQGDDPNIDLNNLIDLSKKSRDKRILPQKDKTDDASENKAGVNLKGKQFSQKVPKKNNDIDLNNLIDLSQKSRDKRILPQNDQPFDAVEDRSEANLQRKAFSQKVPKKNRDGRNKRRKKKKKTQKLKKNVNNKMENKRKGKDNQALKRRKKNKIASAMTKHKTRKEFRKKSKKGENGKMYQSKPKSVRRVSHSKFNASLQSLNPQRSYRENTYLTNYEKRHQAKSDDRRPKHMKSSAHKNLKSTKKRLKSLILKQSRKNKRNRKRPRSKQARSNLQMQSYKLYTNGQEIMEDNYNSDRPSRSRLSRNKNSRKKQSRIRRLRPKRPLRQKHNKKQQPIERDGYQFKNPVNGGEDRYFAHGRINDNSRSYIDTVRYADDQDYYYDRNSRWDFDEDDYYYVRRSRNPKRHFSDHKHFDSEKDYDRGNSNTRHSYDDFDDFKVRDKYPKSRQVSRRFHRKENYEDRVDYSRGDRNSKRISNDDEVLYYIYPIKKRGRDSRRYDSDDENYRVDTNSRRYPPASRTGSSHSRSRTHNNENRANLYPRRRFNKQDTDVDPYGNNRRKPDSRWDDRDEGISGYPRRRPNQNWREYPGYGSSERGPQEIRGRGGSHHSRKDDRTWDDNDDMREGYDSQRNRNPDLNSGRNLHSTVNHNNGPDKFLFDSDESKRRPYYRGDNDIRQRQENRIKALEHQRRLQLQRMAPRVNQKIQIVKQHLQGVLRHYTHVLSESEGTYKEIFNGTRYSIMSGMGDVYEDLNSANNDIYDAVMGSSHTTRTVFMKAHKKRDAELKGLTLDDPRMPIELKEAKSMVKDRNFRPTLLKAQMEKRKLDVDARHFKMLEMRYNQGKARLQQVKGHFKESYDHDTVLNIFNNMRSSIEYVNEELACSHNLRPLRQNKLYIDHAKKEIEVAKSAIKASRDAVQAGMIKFMEINNLYRKWEAEKERNVRRHRQRNQDRGRRQRDQGRTQHVRAQLRRQRRRERGRLSQRGHGRRQRYRVKRNMNDSRQYDRLRQMVSQCRRHSMELSRTALVIQRTLERPIMIARAAIQQRGKKIPLSQLTPLILQLKINVKDMFVALDNLKHYVYSQPKIVSSRGCKDVIEGSGGGNGDDEDSVCLDEVESTKGEIEDDFTFEEDTQNHNTEIESSTHSNPIKPFGVRLSEYTTQLLGKSENLHEAAHQVLVKARKDLRNQVQVAVLGSGLSLKKDIQSNLVTLKSDVEEVKSWLNEIFHKLHHINEVDFDYLKAKALKAIKYVEEKSNSKATTTVTGSTESTKGRNNNRTVTETGSVEFSELFRKGKEIQSNREDIKYLQNLAVNVYSRSCNKMNKIHNNISTLMQKIEKARNMLSSLQLSMSKKSDSPVPVKVPPSHEGSPKSLVTSMSICIKPKSLDGTVLYVQGNKSASYALELDGGELIASVYDEDDDKMESVSLDDELEEDKWYTIKIIRSGKMLNLIVKGQDDRIFQESVEVDDMPLLQPSFSFIKSFIGGIPDDAEISGDPWQGCVGEFVLDGRSLSTFQTALDGQKATLCSDNCISQDKHLTWSFDGDGFVHYSRPPQERLSSISIIFKTTQSTGSILSAVNKRQRFHLYVAFHNGRIKLETADQTFFSLNDSLNDGDLHTLRILFTGRSMITLLDGDESAFSVDRSQPDLYRSIKEGILLGSFVSKDQKFLDDKYRPLIGCVGRLVINENPMFYTDATEVHQAHYGHCNMRTVWQSCARFTKSSSQLSLGSVEDSNVISLLVDRNATGPLMLYDKEDTFEIDIRMTDDSIDILGSNLEAVLLKTDDEDANPNDIFTLLTIIDDGKNVLVSAFGQSTEYSYASWFASSDTSSPHTISLGQSREEDNEQPFTGSLSQLVIGDRFLDLMKYGNKLESCTQQLKAITPKNVIHEEKHFCS